MSTFIEKIRKETKEYHLKSTIEEKLVFEEKKDALMVKLTLLYHDKIIRSISGAAKKGKSEKYMNFNYEDFKGNYPGLGKPSLFQDMWLQEMANPSSKYLEINDDGEKLQCLEGITWNIWGNAKFTTVFQW